MILFETLKNWAVKLRYRQGGSASNWNTYGTTYYDVRSVEKKIEVGSCDFQNKTAGVTYWVSFKESFSATPLVFLQIDDSGFPIINAVDVSSTGFNLFSNSNTSGNCRVYYLAIGPA